MKRFFERYLGVPPAEAGQGTAWRFEWDLPWPAWVPNWLACLVAVALVAGVVWVYTRDAGRTPVRRRVGLVVLRLLALLLVAVFLTRPRLSVERTGLPTVVVLVDDSASMQIEDRYPEKTAEAVAKALSEASLEQPTRLRLAQSILLRDDGAFPRRLLRDHKLRVYRFSDGVAPVGRAEYVGEDSVDELLAAVRALEPQGLATRPATAVRRVLEDLRGTPPSAIVVLSDGISTTGPEDRLSEASAAARDAVVPLLAVGLGRDEPVRDLQLYDLLVDEVAFVNDAVTFSAKLKASGADAETAELVLRDAATGRELKRSTVPLSEDEPVTPVELTYTPTTEGRFEYVLEANPLEGERNRENNVEKRTVVVREERLRVLLVDGGPRYEFRFVKHVLERERTIELHTVLQEADPEYVVDDRTALEHFPVRREDLAEYDVVLFGDVDPGFLGPAVFENLVDFVVEDGGGLLFVAGREFNPLGYRGTPLVELLPFDLETAVAPEPGAAIETGFRPRLTPAGRNGIDVFRFDEDEETSEAIWQTLPELYWMVSTPDTRPGAIVLAERPGPGGVGRALPVIVTQQVGAGKVLYQATDDLWLWRQWSGDAVYGRYWVQAIRHLSRARLLDADAGVEITTQRRTFQQGETVQVRVRFRDESLAPLGDAMVSVMVERSGDQRTPLELSRSARFPNVYEGRLPGARAGVHRVWLVRPAVPGSPPTWEYRVETPDREMQETALAWRDLKRAADRTDGRYFTFRDAAGLAKAVPDGNPVRLESRAPIPLWSRWELLALFAALLLAEWLLRKREQLV